MGGGGYLFFKQSGVGLMYSITSISIDQFYCNRNTYEMTVTQEIKYTTANFFLSGSACPELKHHTSLLQLQFM